MTNDGTYEGRLGRGVVRREHPTQRSFFHSLDTPEREAFTDAATEQVFWPGTTLCRKDDLTADVMLIKSGWVKVVEEINGQEQIVAIRGPGDTVGERAALRSASRSATVVALETVRTLVVPADQFRDLLAEHPHLLQVLNQQEYERSAHGTEDGYAGEREDTEWRLAKLLLELTLRRGGFEQDGAVTITLPMSAHELAGWVGAPYEAVISFLNSWRRRGIVHAARHQVTVIDGVALEKICGPSPLKADEPDGPEASKLGCNPLAPLNCTIFFTDIANFGDPRRDDDDRRVVRESLYTMLRESFEGSHVSWASCVHEDRGDGVLIIAPATVSTVPLVDPLLPLLAFKLKRHNRRATDRVRIQLRVAVHVGPVLQDGNGLSGQALIHTARMLDAPILKESLAITRADLAVMASAHVYDTVIRHTPGLVDPGAFRRVRYQVKEAKIISWMYLAGATRNRPRAGTPRRGVILGNDERRIG
jgi:CRP-like cAMP-binding protein